MSATKSKIIRHVQKLGNDTHNEEKNKPKEKQNSSEFKKMVEIVELYIKLLQVLHSLKQ